MVNENEDFLKVMGKNIRKLRNYLSLTMVEVSTSLEISQPYLSQIETGKKDFRVNILTRIAFYFTKKSGFDYNFVMYVLFYTKEYDTIDDLIERYKTDKEELDSKRMGFKKKDKSE